MTLTEEVSRLVVETSFNDLPAEAVAAVKRAAQDCLGCGVAGTREQAGAIMLSFLSSARSAGECRVIGSDMRLSAPEAALANGVLAHALDYDDVNNASIAHTSVVLVPAALAACELSGASGKDLITAYAVGFEMIARLGRYMLPEHYDYGWHSTSTLGVMGAAAAAGKALDLETQGMAHAFGIAASLAAGTQQNFGTMTKPLHAGHAARAGLMAAMLAKQGFSAEEDILGRGFSFPRLFGGARVADLSGLASAWGNPWEILESGITIKKYPCCAGNHSSLDAALELVHENDIKPEEVESVTCEVPRLVMNILHRHRPESAREARFSLEFAMAAAIADRAAGLAQYTDAKVGEAVIRSLMEKVEIREMEQVLMKDLDGGGLKGSRVTIGMKNGIEYQGVRGEARGSMREPLSDLELEKKFRECVFGIMTEENIKKALSLISRLETLDRVNKLTEVFRPTHNT